MNTDGQVGSVQSRGDFRVRYVIVTPARNEESNIRKTLNSVVNQTLLPLRWIIVNDGSTDRTGEIVSEYELRYKFISQVTASGVGKSSFGSKVRAFQAGMIPLEGIDYDYIANLDGDVSFYDDYFETLLQRMEKEKALGLAGGLILEEMGNQFHPQSISANSVAGAVQCFRRSCYEDFGGYLPLEIGGIDSMAEIMARQHGWRVKTFFDLPVKHHGRVTTGAKNILATRLKKGRINYALGYHPLFQILVGFRRMSQSPYVVGGLLVIAGYALAALKREQHSMPPAAVDFLRKEQMDRLRTMWQRFVAR